MTHVICVDGLGGSPETTFAPLANVLDPGEFWVHYVDTKQCVTYEDRCNNLAGKFHELVRGNAQHIFMAGQSAGGSAVAKMALMPGIRATGLLRGQILLSPAMPRGIWYSTPTLMKIMRRYFIKLFTSGQIYLTDEEMAALLQPISPGELAKVNKSRVPIATHEARKLALWPDRFEAPSPKSPICMIYGSKDNWIRPQAHEHLMALFRRHNCKLEVRSANAGHLTLSSSAGVGVAKFIRGWMNAQVRNP